MEVWGGGIGTWNVTSPPHALSTMGPLQKHPKGSGRTPGARASPPPCSRVVGEAEGIGAILSIGLEKTTD